jgi:hypothetical protein
MNRLLTLLAIAVVLGWTLPASADDKKEQPAHPPDNPGPIHFEMVKRVGEYTTRSEFFAKPGDKPMGEAATGTATVKSLLEGRFLQYEEKGTMLGQPFTSLKLVGYNNNTQQFESTWIYTGSTGMMTMTGKMSPDYKTINYNATADGPNGKMNMAVTIRLTDADHFTTELAAKLPDGAPGPVLVTTYSRKK